MKHASHLRVAFFYSNLVTEIIDAIELHMTFQNYIGCLWSHDDSIDGKANLLAFFANREKVFIYVGSSLVWSCFVQVNKIGNIWMAFCLNPNGNV
ncbi:hypothetical protein KU73_07985 [Pectobacterium wasabiae]|uniref:Uncharacterized protein n=1 Tax=Pectobacterium wasabiae TaxID=55208 RepID=A0AAW3EJC1_9GAMM|nr:hypothetical protein A7983_15295 [Pectobacterium wasabiae CFBP 3304]EJS93348.1 Hypothetical protein Y17_3371 [Pectobacterium wasabiae CFBP 3304]KFX08916.1 hypothetical protein JV38_04260 [Pectobacterium wasabiae]KGA29023.1 hypothetical protein KU73_07985 [Pectobacterium wasabiae]